MRTSKDGFTIIEVTLAAAILIVIVAALIRIIPGMTGFYQQYQVRSQQSRDARIYMDTITRTLEKGQASTVLICTTGACLCGQAVDLAGVACVPPTSPNPPPNSHAEFNLIDGTKYVFYQENSQAKMAWRQANGQPYSPKILANNVDYIRFEADAQDPGSITVGLRLVATYGTGNTQSTYVLEVPSIVIRPQGIPQ